MKLKRDTDYAIRLLVYYARRRVCTEKFVFRREVLHETGVPAAILPRICQILREEGYLESTSIGRETGYRLLSSPREITLKRIIELTENSTNLLATFDPQAEIYSHTAWATLQNSLDESLDAITVADLMQ